MLSDPAIAIKIAINAKLWTSSLFISDTTHFLSINSTKLHITLLREHTVLREEHLFLIAYSRYSIRPFQAYSQVEALMQKKR
jgi:hypothetical protein